MNNPFSHPSKKAFLAIQEWKFKNALKGVDPSKVILKLLK
jgi:hypothetical protein